MTPTTFQHDLHTPVDYDDSKHLYSYKGRRYTSATQLLDQFKHHFDVEERSVYMADRYGNTPQYWKEKWRRDNSDSLERGDGIHSREEQALYKKKFIDYNPVALPVVELVDTYSSPLINLIDGVYPEMKLWRHDDCIAGRSDKIIITTQSPGKLNLGNYRDILGHYRDWYGPMRVADIEDYKTNKKIRTLSYQNPDGTYRMMLGPLSHLMDCELVHYSLQLSIYQYMAEAHGFFPGKRRIIHFPHPIEGLGTPKPVPYDLPYLRDEVIAMIQHTKSNAA